MATFTLTLREVLEFTDDIGLTRYPIFAEEYRETLNQKIVNHYYNQEIGLETIDMFVFRLRAKMNEIMPIYNKLYLSERLAIDPLNTMSISTVNSGTETATGNTNTDSAGSNESTADSKGRVVQSNTPQGRLSGDGDYATAASDTVSSTESKGEATESIQATENVQREQDSSTLVSGWQGSQAELLLRYRETFLNIDMMVIDELGPLFMLLWGNGDNYSPNRYHNPGFPLFGRF